MQKVINKDFEKWFAKFRVELDKLYGFVLNPDTIKFWVMSEIIELYPDDVEESVKKFAESNVLIDSVINKERVIMNNEPQTNEIWETILRGHVLIAEDIDGNKYGVMFHSQTKKFMVVRSIAKLIEKSEMTLLDWAKHVDNVMNDRPIPSDGRRWFIHDDNIYELFNNELFLIDFDESTRTKQDSSNPFGFKEVTHQQAKEHSFAKGMRAIEAMFDTQEIFEDDPNPEDDPEEVEMRRITGF